MNTIAGVIAAAALGAGTAPPDGPAPVIAVQSINPTTSLLVAPTTGQAFVAIEVNGLLLVTGGSPGIAIPLTAPNAARAGGVQLLTGLR